MVGELVREGAQTSVKGQSLPSKRRARRIGRSIMPSDKTNSIVMRAAGVAA